MVLSVAEAQGRVPTGSSWSSARPLLILECLRATLVALLNETILPAACAYNVSASSTFSPESGTDLEERIGAVKERRIKGGRIALSGVDGADARAIQKGSSGHFSRMIDAWSSIHTHAVRLEPRECLV